MSQRTPYTVHVNYQERAYIAYILKFHNCSSLGALITKLSTGDLGIVQPVPPSVTIQASIDELGVARDKLDDILHRLIAS